MSTILSVNNLVKNYGALRALNGISFKVPEGSVFGILGPNGSGKTTLLGIVLDILIANEGHYEWFGGTPAHKARRTIGSLLETPNFYPYLSAEKNLQITARIKGQTDADILRVLEQVKLKERKDSKFNTFSLGMKQRLAIANALLGGPKVLLLDEPTNGLDPEGIAEVRSLIRELSESGMTIIMASHLLDEVEKVCTHVAVMKKGTLLTTGSLDEAFAKQRVLEVASQDMNKLEELAKGMTGVQKMVIQNKVLLLTIAAELDAQQVNQYFFNHGIVLSHLQFKKASLETQFMALTQNVN